MPQTLIRQVILSSFIFAKTCLGQTPDDRDPTLAQPLNFGELVTLELGIDWLCWAADKINEPNSTVPDDVKQCVKDAKRDIEKASGGTPQGPDGAGGERQPLEVILVDRVTRWGMTANMAAYTTVEELVANGNVLKTKSTSEVGAGSERVIISAQSFRNVPWLFCSLLAHEGKRLGHSEAVADANNMTPAENKKKAEGDLKAYCTNIEVLKAARQRLMNKRSGTAPMSKMREFLDKQINTLFARIAEMEARKREAQAAKEKYCG